MQEGIVDQNHKCTAAANSCMTSGQLRTCGRKLGKSCHGETRSSSIHRLGQDVEDLLIVENLAYASYMRLWCTVTGIPLC